MTVVLPKLRPRSHEPGAIWKRFLNSARWMTKYPVLFRAVLVPNLPYLKTVTWTAFRVNIFFALFEKIEV